MNESLVWLAKEMNVMACYFGNDKSLAAGLLRVVNRYKEKAEVAEAEVQRLREELRGTKQ